MFFKCWMCVFILFLFACCSHHGFPVWPEGSRWHDVYWNSAGLLAGCHVCADPQVGTFIEKSPEIVKEKTCLCAVLWKLLYETTGTATRSSRRCVIPVMQAPWMPPLCECEAACVLVKLCTCCTPLLVTPEGFIANSHSRQWHRVPFSGWNQIYRPHLFCQVKKTKT